MTRDADQRQNADTAALHRRQRLADGAACLEAALRYQALGWSVLAVCPPDHVGVGRAHAVNCTNPGKTPWGPWKPNQERAASEAELRKKWRDNPTLNVGAALGPVSGVVRIDVDGAGGGAKLLAVSAGDIPPTAEFASGKPGSRGLLYAIPAGAHLRTTVFNSGEPKSELRFQALGAQTVLPPSRHVNGTHYASASGRSPFETDMAPMPAWLLAALSADGASAVRRGRGPAVADGEPIRDGYRDSTLASMATWLIGALFDQGGRIVIHAAVSPHSPTCWQAMAIELLGRPATSGAVQQREALVREQRVKA